MTPIALFCFKRLDTLSKCIESLQLCPESINADLIIFSDAGRNEEEQMKVDEVRSYIKDIVGFKRIQINLRVENLGVDYNIIQGIQEMAQTYESFIVVEDDLIVSRDFISFMNTGLTHFRNYDQIITISAFNYVKIPKNYNWDCYFAGRTNPWGWATWSHKIKEVDWDLALTNNFLSTPAEMKAFNTWGSDMTRMLRRTLEGEIKAWDIRLDYFLFKRDLLTAYSKKNLVVNNGFNREDASNTTGYNRFKVEHQLYLKKDYFFPNLIFFDSIIKRRFKSKNSILNRCITYAFKFFGYKN